MRAKCCLKEALGMFCTLYMYNHAIPTMCGYDIHCTVLDKTIYFMAELVCNETEISEWFTQWPKFCATHHKGGMLWN